MKGRRSTPEDFWARVNKDSDCWLWQGSLHSDGYGWLTYQGRNWLAQRLAWTLTYGDIPLGLDVLHSCDVRPCCKPLHLFLGTNLDNIQDKVAKGRAGSKLSRVQVEAIRLVYSTGNVSQQALALRYGLCQQMVSLIISKKSKKRW